MRLFIRNGYIVDPLQGYEGVGSLIVEGGRITGMRPGVSGAGPDGQDEPDSPATTESTVIDATGLHVLPGLIDLHAHLREPGFEFKETIRTGTAAAVRGGFTTVCCMPNTNPVNDNPSVTGFILKKTAEEGSCSVCPIGAITKGQKGEELAEIGLMREAGCVGFSDDGRPVMSSLMMRRALEYTKAFGVPVISHCEDLSLSDGGVMNDGLLATMLGLKGVPAEAEDIMVARDILLARLTGGRVHIAHVSTAGSVALIRRAKEEGVTVTAETCPHYFSVTEDAVQGYNTNAKVNPPLRTARDVEAIREGLRDGTIDIIATDHAPHHSDEKLQEFDKAPSGISGFETALGLSLKLVHEGVLTWPELVEKMSLGPARILGLPRGTLKEGSEADITIVDAGREFIVEPRSFISLGKNTPFGGWSLKGTPVITVCRGTVHALPPAGLPAGEA
jgi:dihydroorotase